MKNRQIAICLVLGFMFFCAGVRQATATPAVETISAPFVTVHIGDTFTIPISITNAVDLQAFQFDLSFNPSVVTGISVTDSGTDFEATAINQGGVLTGITGIVTSNAFVGVADSMGLVSTGLQGNGSLAFLTFTALKPGVSPLTFSNVFLDFLDTGFAISNGQITVVPEPTSLMLLAGGLLLLGGRRLARRGQREL